MDQHKNYLLRKHLEDNWTSEAKGTIKKENRFVKELNNPLYSTGDRSKHVSVYFDGKYLVMNAGGRYVYLKGDVNPRTLETIVNNLA